MSHINLIAAVDEKRLIGNGDKLVWRAPGDMKRFVEITTGHPIIMGRKTFESFGKKEADGTLVLKVLPNRTNIIITRNKDFKAPEGCYVFDDVEKALAAASKFNNEIFVIGGGEIYTETIKMADKLYLTLIHAAGQGDVFFPDYSEFKKVVSKEEGVSTEKFPQRFEFLVLER